MKAFIPKNDARGFIMPNFIFEDFELNCGSKMLFSTLCDYARDKNYCYPSLKTLADRLNVSLNTLKTWLQQLVEQGYVKTRKTLRGLTFFLYGPLKFFKKVSKFDTTKNSTSCNNNEKQSKMSKNDEKPSNFDTEVNVNNQSNLIPPNPPKSTQEKPTEKEKQYTKTNTGCEYIPFEEIWKIYPRKENYVKAKKAFFHARKKSTLPSLDFFKEAVAHFLKDAKWIKENGRFIPQLHNFLNDLRWKEYEEYLSARQEIEQNYKSSVVPFSESLDERTERHKHLKLEEEKEAEKKEMLSKAWEEFSKNFIPDNSLNKFTSERYFYKYYVENNNFITVKSSQNMTAYEYMQLLNLME